jgi:hypothetical protein
VKDLAASGHDRAAAPQALLCDASALVEFRRLLDDEGVELYSMAQKKGQFPSHR